MRNTVEYPITKEEIIDYLKEEFSRLMKEGAIGDIRPSLILEAIKAVEEKNMA